MDAIDVEQVVDPLVLQLIHAAMQGEVAQVGALLDQGADIEGRSPEEGDMSALDRACEEGHREVVALLLDRGGDIDAADVAGWTPILLASYEGYLDIVELLHARGANIHHTKVDGENALHLAAFIDHLPICEFLLSKGADLMAATNDGDTALSQYGNDAYPVLSPETKALRRAALEAAHAKIQLSALNSTIEVRDSSIKTLQANNDRLSAVTHTIAALLFSDAFSDLVFVCPGGERIHAHRCIVSASSPYARVLLQGPWSENAGQGSTVQVPQSAAAVRALLRFLYTGEPDAAAIEASMSGVLELASQHEQPALKAACERHAMAALSVATVVPILVAAHLHDLPALKAACVDLIKANSFAVTLSLPFMELRSKHQLLWRELRAALGLPEEEEEEEEGEEGQEQEQDRKRARHEN